MAFYGEVSLRSGYRSHWIDITSDVRRVVEQSSIRVGLCTVTSLHTTGAITINENADPDVASDFFRKLGELIPQEHYFKHSEGNSDSHLKTSLVGLSVQVPINNGQLVLGTWQSVYFCEFDGPRSRRVSVTVIGD